MNLFLEPIRDIDSAQRKLSLLPLQGDPWKEWGRLQKKIKRERNFDESSIAKNQTEQNKLRLRQIRLYESSEYKFTEKFVADLSKLDPSITQYFPIWVKLLLDEWSRNSLPALHDEYHRKWAELRKEDGSASTKKKTELSIIEKKLSDASFGMEHILRELGQIYEAMKQSPVASQVERVRQHHQ